MQKPIDHPAIQAALKNTLSEYSDDLAEMLRPDLIEHLAPALEALLEDDRLRTAATTIRDAAELGMLKEPPCTT